MDLAELSRLLFEARERIDMAGDMVERVTGQSDTHARTLVKEIDEFRVAQGWSPNGFGGE